MKVKASLTIMIKIGNGFLFGSEVADKPRGVKNCVQFIFKLLQDHFIVKKLRRFLFWFLEQNGIEKVG